MLDLTVSAFNGMTHDQVVMWASQPGDVKLRVDGPLVNDPMKTSLLIVALQAHDRQLSVELARSPISIAIAQSLTKSLFGPLLWGNDAASTLTIPMRELAARRAIVASSDQQVAYAHTSRLSARHPDEFQGDLLSLMRLAGISVPHAVVGAVTTIGFEAVSNAEEHAARDPANRPRDVLRFLAIRRLSDGPPPLSEHASEYVGRFGTAGHGVSSDWLEMLVADAGMGLAYPSYFVLAEGQKWPSTNVYEADPDVERARLQLVLDDATSTKGAWGQVVNRHTAPGQGTRYIKFRLASVRGYAGVRTGRSTATWSHPELRFAGAQRETPPLYTILRVTQPLLVGTVWQILVPLNPQLALQL